MTASSCPETHPSTACSRTSPPAAPAIPAPPAHPENPAPIVDAVPAAPAPPPTPPALRASSVNNPISTALNSVFEAQNPRPICIIFSGVGCSPTMTSSIISQFEFCFGEFFSCFAEPGPASVSGNQTQLLLRGPCFCFGKPDSARSGTLNFSGLGECVHYNPRPKCLSSGHDQLEARS